MTDKSYYDLMQYGIRSLNYEVTADGGLDTSNIPEEHRFSMGSWAWRNGELDYKNLSEWSERQRILDMLNERRVPNPFAAFALDVTPVQAEAAAMKQVYDQYLLPLHTGLVENVDEAYVIAVERLHAAGFERFKAEVQRQLEEYAASLR